MENDTKNIEIALRRYFAYQENVHKGEETYMLFTDTWGLDDYELLMQETEKGYLATLESQTGGFIYGNTQPLDLPSISEEILEAYWSNEVDYQEDTDF